MLSAIEELLVFLMVLPLALWRQLSPHRVTIRAFAAQKGLVARRTMWCR